MGNIINPNSGQPFGESNGKSLPKILVGVICGGSIVDSAFAETYSGALIGHGELFWAEQMWIHGGVTDGSRNEIVKQGLKGGFDFVYFMDTDMVFPKGALVKLMVDQRFILEKWPEHSETPFVVGGIYNTRSDHRLNFYEWSDEHNGFFVKPVEPNSGVHKGDFIATGCQLIDLGLFESMEYPWFEYWYRAREEGGEKDRWSEDAVFAYKCKENGIPHFADSNVVCKHIHSCLVSPVSGTEFQVERLSGQAYEDSIQNTGDFLNVKQGKVAGATDAAVAEKKVSRSGMYVDKHN